MKNILNYTEYIREFVDVAKMHPVERIMHATKNAIPQEIIDSAKAADAEEDIQKDKPEKSHEGNQEEGDSTEPTRKQVG